MLNAIGLALFIANGTWSAFSRGKTSSSGPAGSVAGRPRRETP